MAYAMRSCLRRESLTQTGSIGFSGGLNEPSILGTQFTTCSITRRLPCMRAAASQQARIFCPENLCSEMPQCFAFVGSRSLPLVRGSTTDKFQRRIVALRELIQNHRKTAFRTMPQTILPIGARLIGLGSELDCAIPRISSSELWQFDFIIGGAHLRRM
jgi:hypothetical protein